MSYSQERIIPEMISNQEMINLSDFQYRARMLVEESLGKIINAEIVDGGLVSHVFRITGENGSGITAGISG